MTHLPDNPGRAALLFGDWPETILWSCLQGIMGAVYGDDPAAPRSAAAVLGDFCFLAGEPLPELLKLALQDRISRILIPRDSRWNAAILRQFEGRAVPITRFATRKDPGAFDRPHLQKLSSGLENPYTIRIIDENIYDLCKKESWSRDLVSQFSDWQTFRALGLGFAVLKDGRPVSGASSYSRYREGIEIEIDTHPDFRRRGLALAERLGYTLCHPYPAFLVSAL